MFIPLTLLTRNGSLGNPTRYPAPIDTNGAVKREVLACRNANHLIDALAGIAPFTLE